MSTDVPVDGPSRNTARELMRAGFDVQRHDTAGGETLLACTGELDLATVPAFEDALRRARAGGRAIILDLSGLEFLDSRGLATILAFDRELRESDGRLTIVRGPDAVTRIFEISGVVDRLEFVDRAPGVFRPAA
jgi:anti-sigma B factor antagonist